MSSSLSAVPRRSVSDWILDASAVIAFALLEPGAERVDEALLTGAKVSSVNLAEVVSKLSERGWSDAEIRTFVARTQAQVLSFEPDDAYVAGLLRERTRRLGLSLGDRACLALALRLGVPALTADRSWEDLDVGVEVILVR